MGRGERVEVARFDALLSTCSEALNLLLPEPDDRRMNPALDAGPNGKIATTGALQHVWAALARVEPEFEDPAPPGADRATKARTRFAALEHWAASRPSREAVLARRDAAGIGAGPVLQRSDVLRGSLADEREFLVEIDDRRGGTRPAKPGSPRSGAMRPLSRSLLGPMLSWPGHGSCTYPLQGVERRPQPLAIHFQALEHLQ